MIRRNAESRKVPSGRMTRRISSDGRNPNRVSPSPSKKTLQWMPLEKHPLFNTTISSNTAITVSSSTDTDSSNLLQNAMDWDAASSRLFVWEAGPKCVHRFAVRFRDDDPVCGSPSSSPMIVEGALPSEVLLLDVDIQATVSHISVNSDGSALLLTSSEAPIVMHLYERTYTVDEKIICRTVIIGPKLFSGQSIGLRILQVSWHPYSSNHLGVLSSDSVFRLFDLSSNLERAEQEFYLQPEFKRAQNIASFYPIAFSFGGQHLWERFSVFILYSNGSLYILCPVVPFESLCNWTHVEELYKDALVCRSDSSNPRVCKNSGLAVNWLEATFPELIERKMEGSNAFVLRVRPYFHLDSTLALQGPLACAYKEPDLEGKPVSFINFSTGKDSVVVFLLNNGLLHVYALTDEIYPRWSSGGSPHVRLDSSDHIENVAMICQSNSEDSSADADDRRLESINGASDDVSFGNPPRLLKLSIVDLSLPKDGSYDCLVSLVPDPLLPGRFYCSHGGGVDVITLNRLLFSNTEAAAPSVRPIFTASDYESPAQTLRGFAVVADSFGRSHFVGLGFDNECFVVEIKGWDEMLPCHFDSDLVPGVFKETTSHDLVSKDLLNGPKAIIIPPSTSLRSLAPDSIEGRSTLLHYVKLFHENYVEYAHKVYIELEQHGEYVKTITDTQLKRLEGLEQSFSDLENSEKAIKDRIFRSFKVYDLLKHRLKNFEVLPDSNKKPLSASECEFNADLDRIIKLELDELRYSINAVSIRLERLLDSTEAVVNSSDLKGKGRRKGGDFNWKVSQLKSSLDLLWSINSENTKKVKLIEERFNSEPT